MNGTEAKVGNKMAPAPLFGQLRVDENEGSEMTVTTRRLALEEWGKIKGKPALTVGKCVTVSRCAQGY